MIYLRPHHSLCIQFFIGKGYSPEFIRNMTNVISDLDKNDPEICITDKCDVICKFCPNNINGKCISEIKVSKIDENCKSTLSLSTGFKIKWKTLRSLADENIIKKGILPEICGECQWKDICINAKSRTDNLF